MGWGVVKGEGGNGEEVKGFGSREIKGTGGAGGVGTSVLGGPICKRVTSGRGVPRLETMRGEPPAHIK